MREPIAIPALQSNYIWLIPVGDGSAYAVDPGEAEPLIEALATHRLSLRAVLITHHHWDHTDGLPALLERHPVPVYGPRGVSRVTNPLADGDELSLPGAHLSVMAVPGHTLDHLAYFQAYEPELSDRPRLFCGDVLFAAGCGRLFEGNPATALASLERIDRLPETTRIYCAHEYTHTNLRFAASVEPHNPAIDQRLRAVERQREQGHPTLPSELSLERRTNPFLRTRAPGMAEGLGLTTSTPPEAVFAELRQRKDRFG